MTTATQKDWSDFKPMDLDAVEVAFPANFRRLAPMYVDYYEANVPDEFRQHEGTRWNRIAAEWFFHGLKKDDQFDVKDGIDFAKAMAHLSALQRSWEPSHQVKEAIVAFLMSLWFTDFVPSAEGRTEQQLRRLRAP